MTEACQATRTLLAEALSRTLTGPEQESLNVHLESCPDCRHHKEALQEDHLRLAAFARSIGAHQARMEDAVMATVNEQMAGLASPASVRKTWSRGIIRWAAAAVILLGVLGGVAILDRTPTTSVAWAQVIARVEAAQDYICRVDQRNSVSPRMEIVQYCSGEHGLRQDMYVKGKQVANTHLNPATGEMVVLLKEQKKFSVFSMDPEQLEKAMASSSSAEFVRGFKDLGFKEIGLQKIDGRTASGIETEAREIWGGVFDEGKLRLWVDLETQWPVKVEFEGKAEGGVTARNVYTDFQWNAKLAAEDFAYQIPADFVSIGDVDYTEVNEQTALAGLRDYGKLTGGRYPGRLVFATAIKEFEAEEKDLRRRGLIDDESFPRLVQVQLACRFFEDLKKQGRQPSYHGSEVTTRDFDKILVSWQLEDGGYRVVYGDMRADSLSAAEFESLDR